MTARLELGHYLQKGVDRAVCFSVGLSSIQGLSGVAVHLCGWSSICWLFGYTMWTILDKDAPKVADQTYRYLFRNGLQGLDPSEAATALNRVVLHLRDDPKATVDRWAPFIHFGI